MKMGVGRWWYLLSLIALCSSACSSDSSSPLLDSAGALDSAVLEAGTDTIRADGAADDARGDLQPRDAGAADTTPDSMAVDAGPDATTFSSYAHGWSQRFGNVAPQYGYGVAANASGTIAITGSFFGPMDFGGVTLSPAGGHDVFIATYDASGTLLWARAFGGTSNDEGLGVAIDSVGRVTAVGRFEGSADFGAGPITSAGATDIFVATYDASGGLLWADPFGSTGDESGHGVVADSNGNITFVGRFQQSVDFGGGALSSAGEEDVVIASYSSSGGFRWAKRYGGAGQDFGIGVTTDGDGNVFATGSFEGSVDFGAGAQNSAGGADIFLASLSAADGTTTWAKTFGGIARDSGQGVAVDHSGNVTITGSFASSVDFGGGVLTSAGGSDIVVASYASNGDFRWAKRFGGVSIGPEWGAGIAVDSGDNLVIAGPFGETVDFGGGPLTSSGIADFFVASYDADGVHRWSGRFGGSAVDLAHGVAVDGSGRVAVTGYFNDVADFGGGPLTSAGVDDVFLLQLAPQP